MNNDDYTSYDLSDFKIKKGFQPLFIDINSDTYVDLVYNQNTNSGDSDLRVSVYNVDTKDFETGTLGLLDTYSYENSAIGCQSIPNKQELILANPSFTSLVDVNSDCISDLYLHVFDDSGKNMGLMFLATRVKTNGEESLRYCLIDTDDLTGATSPTFADFDNDAAIDKALYNTQSNTIEVYYNQYKANSASSSNLCKSMPRIEDGESKTDFSKYLLFEGTPDVTALQEVQGLYSNPTVSSFIPGQLRVTDLDSNGYPDIIVTLQKTDSSIVTSILINTECNTEEAITTNTKLSTSATDCKDRMFTSNNDYSSISENENVLYGFLLDFDDNGRMDIILVATGTQGTTNLISFYNNYARDSYYITATTYTTSNSQTGSKVYGVSYRGVYTTLKDSNRVFVSSQLSRTGYGALESPVSTYAIGRSNNYIEDFTAAYPVQKYTKAGGKDSLSQEISEWTPIIPNSHLLIDLSSKSSGKWGIKLLINPTDSFVLVGIILTLILIIIGGVIIYMHIQEKKEDEESRNPQLDFF